MDDQLLGAEGTDVLHSAGATASADLVRPAPDGRCKLSVGARWHGFHVEGLAPGESQFAFEATNIGQMEKVLILASPVTKASEWRKAAWQKLCTQVSVEARVLGCIESFTEDGWRYEVMTRPPATTLREWMSSHQADRGTHINLLAQLSAALAALHAAGVVHLNIRPETIYIEEKDGHIDIVLGGLEAVTLYNLSAVAVAAVDPLYAPPEAVDPAGPRPGIALCAWDWWTVGRVLQELIIGRHVMSVLFASDVVRNPTLQVQAQARALLLEQEPPGVRAGAVEAMTGLDPEIETMLHGLLTTVRDARWGGDMVRRWLAKERVTHHYELARDARFFTWKGRGLALPEAVEFFCLEENWADGEENAFNPDNPDTLANFLQSEPVHEADWRKLREIHATMDAPEWSGFPAPARRTIGTALAWLVLGPQPRGLVVRGRAMDAPGLTALLNDSQHFYNCAEVKMLLAAPCLALVQPLDSAATEVLARLAAVGPEALRRAEGYGWVNAEDQGGQAQVLRLALESELALRTKADRVRATFPASRNPDLAGLLDHIAPEPWVNVLLIITGSDPQRFGYVSRAEHTRQQLAGMEALSDQLRRAVFWLRLERMLLSGGPCTGRWKLFVSCWLVLVFLGVAVARENGVTFGLAVGFVILRLLFRWRVGVLVRRSDQSARPWNWRDGPDRCRQEAKQAWPAATAATLPKLTQDLATLEGKMAALAPVAQAGRAPIATWLAPLRVGAVAGALLCVFGAIRVAVSSGNAVKVQIASFTQDRTGATDPARPTSPGAPTVDGSLSPGAIPGLSVAMQEKVAHGEYEFIDDGFGPVLHGPLTKWDHPPPAAPAALPVESRQPATSSQRAYALVSAELLLRPYPRKGVNALLVVRVPLADQVGVMMYNARDHLLVDNDTLVMRGPLAPNRWYKFENRNVIYLGTPAEIRKENSLALR